MPPKQKTPDRPNPDPKTSTSTANAEAGGGGEGQGGRPFGGSEDAQILKILNSVSVGSGSEDGREGLRKGGFGSKRGKAARGARAGVEEGEQELMRMLWSA